MVEFRRTGLREIFTRPIPRGEWPNLRGIHVAVVEDNADTRALLHDTLRHCGAMVTSYRSAPEALLELGAFLPSLIVCDLALPGLDGVEFMRRANAQLAQLGKSIPAIAITAFDEDYAATAAVSAGFAGYLTKPAQIEQLCALIEQLCHGVEGQPRPRS
jgi:CheY-like chemotaxis protein